MANYDIIIVVAGNAGLSAAIQCQLAGKKPLLIEQHNLPDGCASSFPTSGLTLEVPGEYLG